MKIKKWKKILALLLIVCMTAIPKVVHAEDTLDATYAYTWTNPEILKDNELQFKSGSKIYDTLKILGVKY